MGKSRVAPLKLITIPRLELTAAVVAVMVDKMLQQELKIPLQQSIFWTDSTTVLRYIDSETARFKTFVANRIVLIREATKPSQWKHVRTTENPADQASRGLKAKNLVQGGTWINGPNFLLNSENDWPEQPDRKEESLPNDPEVKNKVTVNAIKVKEDMEPLNELINYYSDWHKLKRSVAWILKERQKWLKPRTNFMTGDVVLLVDSSSPRNSWLMGKVVETLPDSNGTVRRVKIKTKTSMLERPVNKLCLLEEAISEE
ncbi:uncharacterized protein LOC116223386 [Clupea harengus]|uniref:Uncharacterized protein LOC116223386 n=1 Tax=Clupea harengus TaxID=7950 RepID=A0A6P8GEJ7_CLUHA|nr:uncharacterized protein LOC116223386 [Clupea harengus]